MNNANNSHEQISWKFYDVMNSISLVKQLKLNELGKPNAGKITALLSDAEDNLFNNNLRNADNKIKQILDLAGI